MLERKSSVAMWPGAVLGAWEEGRVALHSHYWDYWYMHRFLWIWGFGVYAVGVFQAFGIGGSWFFWGLGVDIRKISKMLRGGGLSPNLVMGEQ